MSIPLSRGQLQELVRERKHEAILKAIGHKIIVLLIHCKFGQHTHSDKDGRSIDRWEFLFEWANKTKRLEILISNEDSAGKSPARITLEYNGNRVFESVGDYLEDVITYIPGSWERYLDATTLKAISRREAAEHEAEQRKIYALKEEATKKTELDSSPTEEELKVARRLGLNV